MTSFDNYLIKNFRYQIGGPIDLSQLFYDFLGRLKINFKKYFSQKKSPLFKIKPVDSIIIDRNLRFSPFENECVAVYSSMYYLTMSIGDSVINQSSRTKHWHETRQQYILFRASKTSVLYIVSIKSYSQ